MTGLEMIVQDYLDVDFCDRCDKPIQAGEPVWLDVDREYAGVVPAYCAPCALELEEAED